jgi:hypothetical protein
VSNALWTQSGFQYGSLFATLSFEVAREYAAHGSEYLRAIRVGLRLLGHFGTELLEGTNSTLKELLLSPHDPAVVEIKGISLNRLHPTKESPSVEDTLRSYERFRDDSGVRMPLAVRIDRVDPAEAASVVLL